MRYILGLLAAALLLAGSWPGSSLLPGAPQLSPPAQRSVQPVFQPFYRGPIVSDEQLRTVRDALPCERISLELSGGMLIPEGRFKLSLHRDGRATLWTEAGSRLADAGDHVGTVNVFDYARICQLIIEARLETLSTRYAVSFSDLQEMTLTVSAEGRTFAISDYGGAAPVQVWGIQRAIEAAGFRIRWKRA